MSILKVIFGFLLLSFLFLFTPLFKAITWVFFKVVALVSWISINSLALLIGAYFYTKRLFKKEDTKGISNQIASSYSI